MKQFDYLKPPDVYKREREYTHRLQLKDNGAYVGFADFEYRNDPFPFYYISMVFIKQAQRGKGVGREIMQEMNAFLDSKKIPGILKNVIDSENPAYTMYEKGGWKPIAGQEGWFGYEIPSDLGEGRLDKAIYEIQEGFRRLEEKKQQAA